MVVVPYSQTFNHVLIALVGLIWCLPIVPGQGENENVTGNMVKMCLFYPSASGHARSDPIINQSCASDHVHTFYGPQNFHPDTTYDDLIQTAAEDSSTPFVENQSLYWHPSIYRISNSGGTQTYTRISDLFTSPYYRWDNSVSPQTEAFPPGFRMIAYSDQEGGQNGGESGGNLFVECCNYLSNDEESCTSTIGSLQFPAKNCDFVGIAFAMPTCWNGDLGIDNDHKSHMAYTVDGSVAGDCPSGFNRRLPQVQLFVRINNYQGASHSYTLADESNVFHVDFFNGWQEGKLKDIIDNCPVEDGDHGYNPPCNCDQFLTPNTNVRGQVCDSDIRNYIVDEATDVVTQLPRGTCAGPPLKAKSWDIDPPFTCVSTASLEDDDTDPAECEDSPLTFKVNINGKRRWRDCAWAAEKSTRFRCGLDEAVQTMCPFTCDTCDECVDSSTPKFQVEFESGNTVSKNCDWVASRKTRQRCNLEGVETACRDTCGLCD